MKEMIDLTARGRLQKKARMIKTGAGRLEEIGVEEGRERALEVGLTAKEGEDHLMVSEVACLAVGTESLRAEAGVDSIAVKGVVDLVEDKADLTLRMMS